MSIKQQVEDAQFLAANGRKTGALMLLMLAVAGSSRKTFPRPATRSLKNPSNSMGDEEAFTLFLGGRIGKIFTSNPDAPEVGRSGIVLEFRGKDSLIEHIFYKYYRNSLVHEGDLPPDVEFNVSEGGARSFSFGVADDRVTLDAGWIHLLTNVVVNARVNGPEFGIEHFDLTPRVPDEASLISEICGRHGITPGRFSIFKHVVRNLSPASVIESTDDELTRKFADLVSRAVVNGGMMTGLRSYELVDEQGRLQETGVRALREIASNYDLVRVA